MVDEPSTLPPRPSRAAGEPPMNDHTIPPMADSSQAASHGRSSEEQENVASEVVPPDPKRAHLFKKGQSGNPAGRPVGTKTKAVRMWAEALELSKKFRISPLEYMLSVVNDPRHYPQVRLDAAKAAAPYVHQKMPLAIEMPGHPANLPPIQLAALQHLSDEELDVLMPILFKLANMAPTLPAPAAPGVAQVVREDD